MRPMQKRTEFHNSRSSSIMCTYRVYDVLEYIPIPLPLVEAVIRKLSVCSAMLSSINGTENGIRTPPVDPLGKVRVRCVSL